MYFKIANKALVPYGKINKVLDKAFVNPEVIKKNIENYNDYTQHFIADNATSYNVFYSDDFSYDAKEMTFNFVSIMICQDSDYEKICLCEFDEKKDRSSSKSGMMNGLSFLGKIQKEAPCPSIEDGFYVENRTWNYLVRNIKRHVNTMLVGPTGTGKTDIIIRICKALGVECNIYDMGAMQDPLTGLLGSHRIENGESIFDYSKFVEDVQKPGVILLDELSRAPLMTNNILFPCLDGRRTLPVDIADSKSNREIKVHPECTFIATANIGAEYSGTNDLDAALINRFMMMNVDYIPAIHEVKVLEVRTGIDKKSAETIITIANSLRGNYMDGMLSKSISTRETIACAELFMDGFTLIDSIMLTFGEKFGRGSEESEYNTVKKIIISC